MSTVAQVYFKARESNLRRYFFASPRLFASLVVAESN